MQKYDSYTEFIEKEYLVQALKVGVDYDLFWKLNPTSLQPFFEAYTEKQKDNMYMNNNYAWLIGQYVAEAISANFSKSHRYPDKPLKLDLDRDSTEPEKDHSQILAEHFEAMALEVNKTLAEKGGKKK